jgi:hypothetical protein
MCLCWPIVPAPILGVIGVAFALRLVAPHLLCLIVVLRLPAQDAPRVLKALAQVFSALNAHGGENN